MIIWTIILIVAALIAGWLALDNIAQGNRDHEQQERWKRQDAAQAWREYNERAVSDRVWATKAAEKIEEEVTQAELKRQDEERNPFRGYTNPEMPEGSPQIALIAKKELGEASTPQIEPFPLPLNYGDNEADRVKRVKQADWTNNPIQGFPHVVASIGDTHSGPFNDPKMSVYARQSQQQQQRLMVV